MARKKLSLAEVLEKGTPKQKALLIIENDEASQKIGGGFLTEKEVDSILDSVRKKPEESRQLHRYLYIAEKYSINRFRFYGLQENLKKLSARIVSLTNLWEEAERVADTFNTILGLLDMEENKGRKDFPHKTQIEKYIYQTGRTWGGLVQIVRKEGSREVEVRLDALKAALNKVIEDYTASFSVAKAIVEASDAFVEKYNVSAFVPDDVKAIIRYFKAPNTEIPEIYRRDTYLQLLRERGAEDREVKYREKYAIVPAYEEIKPHEGTKVAKLFEL